MFLTQLLRFNKQEFYEWSSSERLVFLLKLTWRYDDDKDVNGCECILLIFVESLSVVVE